MMRAGGVMMVRPVLLVLALCCACVCVTAAAEPGKAAVQNSGTTVAQQKANGDTAIRAQEERAEAIRKVDKALKNSATAAEAVENAVNLVISGLSDAKVCEGSATEAVEYAGEASSHLCKVYDLLLIELKKGHGTILTNDAAVVKAIATAEAAMTAAVSSMGKAKEAEVRANSTAEKALSFVKQAEEALANAKKAVQEASAAATGSGAATKAKEAADEFTKAVESATKAAVKSAETVAVESSNTAMKAKDVFAKARESAQHAKKAVDEFRKLAKLAPRTALSSPPPSFLSAEMANRSLLYTMDDIYFAQVFVKSTKNAADELLVEAKKLANLAEVTKQEGETANVRVGKVKAALEAAQSQAQTELKQLLAELKTLTEKQIHSEPPTGQQESKTDPPATELPTTASADVPKVDPKELIKNKNADSSSSSAWVCAPLLVLVCVLSCSIAVW
ncbi:hypothetical protein DQ04_05691000 [Trypanosoma grayi]|uniref:hypothetical protein n=1 Tax=Trypanosoma grayi TaxID=71804 RepID=UPI0004F435D2|nr:hypothetical protein DQ04_05691000 [Trypanosoma grayi]KEG09164.1 hypothetical protein DQ04_05691000 [Trypanosoma grayi]